MEDKSIIIDLKNDLLVDFLLNIIIKIKTQKSGKNYII